VELIPIAQRIGINELNMPTSLFVGGREVDTRLFDVR